MPFVKLAFEKRLLDKSETPESLFSHLQGAYSCLMRSSGSGRYSYIGYDPFLVCSSRKGVVKLQKRRNFFEFKKSSVDQLMEGDLLAILKQMFSKVAFKDQAPVPFFGGGAGYFSYDFGTSFEGVKQQVFDDIKIPEYVFCFFDKVVAFDHHTNELFFLGLAETDLLAQSKIVEIKNDLQRKIPLVSAGEFGEFQSNLTLEKYKQKIEMIRQMLEKGETYQVNFSQRFSASCTLNSWKIFQQLMEVNPAPFSCYFDFDDFQIISASPELLVRKRNSEVESWPIKGTVARGKDEQEDLAQIETLLSSKKDEAELSMIVDLARNDLGKVCKIGSVKVKSHREIQKLAHVIHTVSKISGQLDSKKDVFDLVKALFPGGSITGCPKKRTMEIIDRLEDYVRGVYTGSAGFMSFSGDADFNILIRTILKKDEKVYFQVGGGIVMDSDPGKEYEETLAKAKGLRAAFEGK